MNPLILTVATEFSRTPGVRTLSEGDSSGEVFLSRYLYPRFIEAMGQGKTLVVNLDGTAGYATSFLEASFGGLVRGDEEHGIPGTSLRTVQRYLRLVCTDDPYLLEEIGEYMQDAEMAAA
ncbi:hypothetical protein GCM10011375_18880 [Hymenobacter qilianensis]|uniref:STAS-like domain-containing protein n=2 Tax=Hymenobacter qilianensis TaxID=1385715 RepID=A0A7H0GUU7_9BACT|nr:STAS-like domain-containing protein [Hymenobacter qilianensis]QNP52063.1 STAS-like domain-containing protein [Hymenobacter qilianensis]GGF64213.1 hypothetical protein GCM10011375_18880 [Hymenobacter qilianensis]